VASATHALAGTVRRLASSFAWIKRRPRTALFCVAILCLVVFAAIRTQVAMKSMIDTNSLGVDYLNIAYGRSPDSPPEDALFLAAEQFARLHAKLDGMSWLIALSGVLPVAHDQFAALDAMADLGSGLVAMPLNGSSRGGLTERGSITSVCASAERLEAVGGNLLGQLEKNRREMLTSTATATNGTCPEVEQTAAGIPGADSSAKPYRRQAGPAGAQPAAAAIKVTA
jgi:hypothetical protein